VISWQETLGCGKCRTRNAQRIRAVVLLWLIAGAALLYFWSRGQSFARVLTFLALVIPLSFLGSAYGHDKVTGLLGFVLGGTAAWFIAGIPIYMNRRRATPIGVGFGAAMDRDEAFASPASSGAGAPASRPLRIERS
jgi:hypothetical protein